MKVTTVAASFATYRADMIPADAAPTQVEECRRAFYAGAYSLLMNALLNVSEQSDEDGVDSLEALKRECDQFAASLVSGTPAPAPTTTHNYTTLDAAEMRPLLQKLGAFIAEGLPTGWGFNLLLFTYGEGGSLFYISSAEREDVIAVMREYINRNTQ